MSAAIDAILDNEVSLLVGTSRRPLRAAPCVPDPSDPGAPLAALAVAAALRLQARRDGPAPLAPGSAVPEGSGRPVTGALREAVLAAFGPLASDPTCRRTLARRLVGSGLEMNPLDLVPLRNLVCAERDVFGGRTLAFADRMDPRADPVPVDPRDWPQWKPGAILELFTRLRREDPAEARDLAASGMDFATKDGKAAVLRGFEAAISFGLAADDAGLAAPHASAKSAGKLRNAARGLISAVPGTDEHAAATAALLDGLKLWGRNGREARWVFEALDVDERFGGPSGVFLRVPIDAVAERIGTDRARLPDAPMSEDLARGLSRRAELEGDFELLGRLVADLRPEAMTDVTGLLEPLPSTLASGRIGDFLHAVAAPFVGPDARRGTSIRPLLDLHARAGLPMAAGAVDAFLETEAWRDIRKSARGVWDTSDNLAAAFAGLVPPERRGRLRLALLSAFPDAESAPALALRVHELIDREIAR